MKLPHPASLVMPRTCEGYRGAFFGLLLSTLMNAVGTVIGLVIVLAFLVGIYCASWFHQLDDEPPEESIATNVDRFFHRN